MGYSGLVLPYANPVWLGGGVHQTAWLFYTDMVHHPAPRPSARSIFIFIRWMVRHLQFFRLLVSQKVSQVQYLRAMHECFASNSFRIPGMLAFRILSFPCPPLRWLPLPQGFVICDLLYLWWRSWARFLDTSMSFFGFCCRAPTWHVSGVPCYSMSLVFWCFSGTLALLSNCLTR